jgi:Predicted pyridoxal phosphate-dependent enzyme apparently involved in regulation of cell wall biogenesis
MKVPFVDLKAQYQNLKADIDQAVANVINEVTFVGGKYVKAFEEAFAQYLGIKHCISCANGTDSLEILLKAMGIGAGDEVIVPANSWISTSEAVSNIGATPVFVDILPDYYTIDPSKMKKKLRRAPKRLCRCISMACLQKWMKFWQLHESMDSK